MRPATARGGRQGPLRSKPPSQRQKARPPTPVPESPGPLHANSSAPHPSRLPICLQKANATDPNYVSGWFDIESLVSTTYKKFYPYHVSGRTREKAGKIPLARTGLQTSAASLGRDTSLLRRRSFR